MGIFLNQHTARDLRAQMLSLRREIASSRNSVDARLDRMQADLSMFYKTLGDPGAGIENLEKKLSS